MSRVRGQPPADSRLWRGDPLVGSSSAGTLGSFPAGAMARKERVDRYPFMELLGTVKLTINHRPPQRRCLRGRPKKEEHDGFG